MASFDERARTWDTPERIARAVEVARVIREAVGLTGTERLIDVGAGTGLLGLALADDVASVVLADPSAGMIEVATDKLANGSFPTARAIRLDLLAGPLPNERFDLAVSLLVLHHLKDTPAALGAIRALLAPGGRMALVDLDTEDGSFHAPDAEGIEHHGFDRAAVSVLAREAGFVDVATRTATEIEDDGRRYPLFLLTGRRSD